MKTRCEPIAPALCKGPSAAEGPKNSFTNALNQWQLFIKHLKNEGNKRRIISDAQIRQIVDLYSACDTNAFSRVEDFPVFGYRRIKVLRHLRFRDNTDKGIGRVGYEINFNRFFHKYVPPRKLVDTGGNLNWHVSLESSRQRITLTR